MKALVTYGVNELTIVICREFISRRKYALPGLVSNYPLGLDEVPGAYPAMAA